MVNILFTDWNPVVAATDSCHRYVIKILVKVALLLSGIHCRHGYRVPVGCGMKLELDDNVYVLSAVEPYTYSCVIESCSET